MALSKPTFSPEFLTTLSDDDISNLPSGLQEDLKIYRETGEELEKRRLDNLCREFEPNGKSEEFIRMIGEQKSFVNLFIGANGTSKTASGVNIIANIVYGPQNEYFEYPLFRDWPYIKKGRIISDT